MTSKKKKKIGISTIYTITFPRRQKDQFSNHLLVLLHNPTKPAITQYASVLQLMHQKHGNPCEKTGQSSNISLGST